MTRPRVVAFDLMDTLVHDPFREALIAATGRPLEDLVLLKDRNAYPRLERCEITEAQYWATYDDVGIDVDPAAFHRVRRAGTDWLPGMRELVDEVREAGCQVVIASNYPTWIEELADGLLADCHDVVHASCHVGVRKPHVDYYLGLADRLGVDTQDVVFVDDRPVNIEAAIAVGMVGIVTTDAAGVREALVIAGALS